jgi:hypothetical protein
MRLYVLFFLLFTGFISSYARLGPYTKVAEERVAWEPADGKNGPAITVLVRVKHDAFFGDANESHIAGKYELGSYVVYKGQRINTASLPDDVKAKIKFSSVNICYDIKSKATGKIVSTKCKGTVMTSDFPGSPNWDKMFPGLSADQAKALYKSGYDIVNIRVTELSYFFPNLDAYVNGTATGNTPSPVQNLSWQTVGYARKGDTVFIKFSDGRVEKQVICNSTTVTETGGSTTTETPVTGSSSCPPPSFKLDGSPKNYCASFIWSCPTVTNQMNGNEFRQVGITYNYMLFEYRKEGDRLWKSEKLDGCAFLLRYQISGLEPCTRYEVRMRASCSNGTMSEYSNILRFETDCTAPGTISFPQVTSTSAKLNYRVQGSDCYKNGYEVTIVEYTTTGMQWNEVEHKGGELILGPLQPGTRYRVRLKTRYSNGKFSRYSTEGSFTTLK